MKVTYDAARDSAFIGFVDEARAAAVETEVCDVEFDSGAVALLLDKDGRLVGIEIMDVRNVLPPAAADELRG
jgi:uncharacterized protein YuzE